MNRSKQILFFLVFFQFMGGLVYSQDSTQYEFSLQSPYHCIYTHLYYLQDDQYSPQTAAQTILPDIDDDRAQKLAIQLKQILDGKGLRVRMGQLPMNSNHVDSLSGRQVYILFPKEYPEIYVEKKGVNWYYSEETTNAIPVVHKQVFRFGLDNLQNKLPRITNKKFIGLKYWQWIGLGVLFVLSVFIHILLWRVLNYILTHIGWIRDKMNSKIRAENVKLARLISALIMVVVIKGVLPVLQFPIRLSEIITVFLGIALTVIVVLVLLKVLRIISIILESLTERTESKMDEQLLPIVIKFAQIFIVAIALFQILNLLNVNVTALIAGISIGGLALALAAQDTVKNLIGSVIIFIDKPFQIGDYVISGNIEGTVEEVGFRSTRLRTVDTSVITVPNGTVANLALKNLGIRTFRMMKTNLGLLYNTPSEKIQEFVDGLKQIVFDHPKIFNDTYYVHLTEFKDSSINILFRIYLMTDVYKEELELKEEVLFLILQLAEKVGVSFAYPSTSVYIEQSN